MYRQMQCDDRMHICHTKVFNVKPKLKGSCMDNVTKAWTLVWTFMGQRSACTVVARDSQTNIKLHKLPLLCSLSDWILFFFFCCWTIVVAQFSSCFYRHSCRGSAPQTVDTITTNNPDCSAQTVSSESLKWVRGYSGTRQSSGGEGGRIQRDLKKPCVSSSFIIEAWGIMVLLSKSKILYHCFQLYGAWKFRIKGQIRPKGQRAVTFKRFV